MTTGMKATDCFGSTMIYCDSCIDENGDREFLTNECQGQIIGTTNKGGRCLGCNEMVGVPNFDDPRFLVAVAPEFRGGVAGVENALGFGAEVIDTIKAASGASLVLVTVESRNAEWNSMRLRSCLLGGQVFDSEAAARQEIALLAPIS